MQVCQKAYGYKDTHQDTQTHTHTHTHTHAHTHTEIDERNYIKEIIKMQGQKRRKHKSVLNWEDVSVVGKRIQLPEIVFNAQGRACHSHG